ncbi:MAG: hypothetical protein N2319_07445 [Candidatus Kapabacteria bacterium]|nr:hypothetical protein [Candidatus Kapabacteria bacterium]
MPSDRIDNPFRAKKDVLHLRSVGHLKINIEIIYNVETGLRPVSTEEINI